MEIHIPQPEVKHLMNRGSFGLGRKPVSVDVNQLFKASKEIVPLEGAERPALDSQSLEALRNNPQRREVMQDLFVKSRRELMKLNVAWLEKMIVDNSLRERMTFFWHGHFACRSLMPFLARQQNNTVRTYALDSFSSLLMAVSKDPAMLQFLNNQQNRKDHPNENFAREVMELFTLGRGNYTEQDVKEAARAFTGWGFNPAGEFHFRQRQHDFGTKAFRGASGDFTGEQVLDAILSDRQTARFITAKLYQSFVSDQHTSVDAIHSWSESFYDSGYDIARLLREIFLSDEFNNPANVGNRIKSPVELLVGIQRQTNGRFTNPQSVVFLQRALGQVMFYPPNVSGWPNGKAWIDSSSLTFRMALPMLLFGGVESDFEARDDGDANGLSKGSQQMKQLHCAVDWSSIAAEFTKSTAEETIETIETFLLARPASAANRKTVAARVGITPSDPEFTRQAFIGFMSLPEYQMC